MIRKQSVTLIAALSMLSVGLLATSGARAYSDFFVIGDSLSDVGNLFLVTGGLMDPATALPQQPPYFSGRFSDGPVFVEHVYNGLGLPGVVTPSFAGGTNYAVGGARLRYHASDNDPIAGFDPSVFDPLGNFDSGALQFSLLGQVGSLLATEGPVLDDQALYSLWVGSNDVSDAILSVLAGTAPTATYPLELLEQGAADVGDAVRDLVDAGARYLLLPTVPDLSLVPQTQEIGSLVASAIARNLSATFNSLVDAQLTGIDADIRRLDTFAFLNALVADPTAFGQPAGVNTNEACFSGFVGVPGPVCADPSNYVFFDRIHPSALTHETLGALVLQAVPAPATIALLVLGAGGLTRSRRGAAVAT